MERKEEHPSGDSPSDTGKSREQLEGSGKIFSGGLDPAGRAKEFADTPGDQLERMGDSRPDVRDPSEGGFERIDEDPRMTTTREEFPEVHKPDPEALQESRTDNIDHIVAKPMGPLGNEGQTVEPRTNKEDKQSSQL